ncbi:MAG TPA: ABC transporter substrate-binding protein [Gammaproteobacteria bacterium]|nr:ABC transporter substrate-binding protein [Gammaproteobacteria bacterium]
MKRNFPICTRLALAASLLVGVAVLPRPVRAAEPIRIAIVTPLAITPGKAVVRGAKLAAERINRAGGIGGHTVKLLIFDSQLSTSASVRAMQRAVEQDHAQVVAGVFTSEDSMALANYAGRLDVPLIVESGSSKIGELIRTHYKRYRNVFQLQLNGHFIAQEVCDAAHSLLLKDAPGRPSAVILSEQAAWTQPLDRAYEACLPKAGFKVLGRITYSPSTTDFGPVYNRIEGLHPTVIVTGMAHTGLRPVLQWQQDQVPALMLGFNMQAGSTDFWQRSNGAAQGVIVVTNGAGGAPITSKTAAFYHAYIRKYHDAPMLMAYTSYDSIYVIADAANKAGLHSTEKLVGQLAATDYVGATGRIRFYGRHARFAHALMYGPGLVTGVAFQWQNGKQSVVWPKSVAQASVVMPSFIADKR